MASARTAINQLSSDGKRALRTMALGTFGLPEGQTAAEFLAEIREISLAETADMPELVARIEAEDRNVAAHRGHCDEIELAITCLGWPAQRVQAAADECTRAGLMARKTT